MQLTFELSREDIWQFAKFIQLRTPMLRLSLFVEASSFLGDLYLVRLPLWLTQARNSFILRVPKGNRKEVNIENYWHSRRN